MKRNVHIGRIRVQRLADHQHSLAMRIFALPEEGNVGADLSITGSLLPHELESILVEPHILAAAGHGVFAAPGVECRGTGVEDRANIAATFKDSEPRVLSPRTCKAQSSRQDDHR